MHRFWVNRPGAPGETADLAPGEAEHLFKVLRFRSGDTAELLDGNGWRGEGVATSERTMRITGAATEPERAFKLHLFAAAPKRQKIDLLLKQAAELGVWRVVLVDFARSVARPDNFGRLSVHLVEGCKQSGNVWLPKLELARDFGELPEILPAGAGVFFGAVRGDCRGMREVKSAEAVWVVGPEGGMTEEEEAKLIEWGAVPVNLGENILRLETAALAGIVTLKCWKNCQRT